MAEIKLTEGGARIIEATAKQGAQTASRHTHRLIEQGLLDNGNELTDAGREYAIANGWLTVPANSEPQAVEAKPRPRLGDTLPCEHGNMRVMCTICSPVRTTNVLNVPASDEIHEDAQPEGGLTDDIIDDETYYRAEEYLFNERQPAPNTRGENAGRAALAQTAPVDGGSDSKLLKCEHGIIVPYCAECYEKDMDGNPIGKTYMANKLLREHSAWQAKNRAEAAKTHEQRELERQQAEIRTLESKLAAAAAALERIGANMTDLVAHPDKSPTHIAAFAQTMLEIALAALQQSGADEG